MTRSRRSFLHLALSAAAVPGVSSLARAQTYPTRPITIVVPFPPGAATDIIARLLADRMRVSLGQPVLVENIGGAGGTIGVGRVARAAPDGYTLSLGHWSTHVVNGAIYRLSYDVLGDFAPITLLTTNRYLILSRKTLPATNLQQLIAWWKDNSDKATAGTGGVGTPQHIGEIFLQNRTGVHCELIPYRGGAPLMQDLVAGRVDIDVDDPTNALPQLRAGAIKAYAVTAKTRLAAAPEIPTVDEAGLPGFYYSRWHALWAPKGTPNDIVATLNTAVLAGLSYTSVRARLADMAQEIFPPEQQGPAALGAFQRAEIEKWWPIIKAAGIKVE